uniref:tRNA-dihydrouridine synthase n=1 Tax=Arcella intermedia TaxID=1963864 RepID=A0A6B2LBB6_9EUKA
MVRYSKLPFRLLCRRWGCDIAYTPMIISEDFVKSKEARDIEFTTSTYDRPLITQFAARSAPTLSIATQYVANYCDGIDINCGCPQKWVISEGYGCALLKKPELVEDLVKHAKRSTNLPVSIKIRIAQDLQHTLDLVQRAERMGVSWITVHGRRSDQRSSALVNFEAVKFVKENVKVPVVANGNCFSLGDAREWKERTGVNGVMAARGLLQNPALFAGFDNTPPEVVSWWVSVALQYGMSFTKIHQHLMFMLYTTHSSAEKSEFNNLKSIPALLEYLKRRDYHFKPVDPGESPTRVSL